jgi:hypothetical protein
LGFPVLGVPEINPKYESSQFNSFCFYNTPILKMFWSNTYYCSRTDFYKNPANPTFASM